MVGCGICGTHNGCVCRHPNDDFLRRIPVRSRRSLFDEEPDGDPHGECAAEIHRLRTELAASKAKYKLVCKELGYCNESPEHGPGCELPSPLGLVDLIRREREEAELSREQRDAWREAAEVAETCGGWEEYEPNRLFGEKLEAARKLESGTEETPKAQCPRCGVWVNDFDGFGVLAHTKPAYSDGCGYCSHPSRDDGVCGICGELESGTEPIECEACEGGGLMEVCVGLEPSGLYGYTTEQCAKCNGTGTLPMNESGTETGGETK